MEYCELSISVSIFIEIEKLSEETKTQTREQLLKQRRALALFQVILQNNLYSTKTFQVKYGD